MIFMNYYIKNSVTASYFEMSLPFCYFHGTCDVMASDRDQLIQYPRLSLLAFVAILVGVASPRNQIYRDMRILIKI